MATYNPYTRSSSLLAGFDEVDYVSTIRMKSKKINGKWKWEPATMQNKFDDLPISVKHLFQKVMDGIFGVWLERSKDNDVMRFFFLCEDDLYYSVPENYRNLMRQYVLWNMAKFNLVCDLNNEAVQRMIESSSGSHYGLPTIYNHMVPRSKAVPQNRFNFDYDYLKEFIDDEGLIFKNDIPNGSIKDLIDHGSPSNYGGIAIMLSTRYLDAIVPDPFLHSRFLTKTTVEPFEV